MSDQQTIERLQQEVVSGNKDRLYQATLKEVQTNLSEEVQSATFDLNDYEKSIFKTIDEINETLKDKERYNLKSKKSFDFINKNLINTKCYQKFKIILEKL